MLNFINVINKLERLYLSGFLLSSLIFRSKDGETTQMKDLLGAQFKGGSWPYLQTLD
jgi:hypothetical protein